MTAPLAQIVSGDYDNKSFDLRTYYAGFTRRPMPEWSLKALSKASSHFIKGHIGYDAWITMVSGTEDRPVNLRQVEDWAIGAAGQIATTKPRLRFRSRTYTPSYDPSWGRFAAIDAARLAVFGMAPAPWPRAKELGCDYEAYLRIRNFVGGAIVLAMNQYEIELKVVFAIESGILDRD